MIHIHDIYFPFQYQRDLLRSVFQWQETALLQALLTHNDHLEIMVCLSLLHYEDPSLLAEAFPGYRPEPASQGLVDRAVPGTHFPASIYIRTR